MYLGEMALLIVSILVMTGLAKGITERLRFNEFAAAFLIFLIVLLNVRGSVRLTRDFSLSLGGVLSVLVGFYTLFKRADEGRDVLLGLLSMIGTAGIAFLYSYFFLEQAPMDPRLLATLLSLLTGLWCAVSAKRTFSSCLFSALVGSFIGIAAYQIFFRKSGNIGGSYAFTVMWFSAIVGLVLQYLFTMMMRAVNSPRANSYFEAGEMKE